MLSLLLDFIKINQRFQIDILSHKIAQVMQLHNKSMHILPVIPFINSLFEEKNITILNRVPAWFIYFYPIVLNKNSHAECAAATSM